MKNWILKMKFVQDYIESLKVEWIKEASIDAFSKALEDLEETNSYNTDEKAKELAEQMLKDLLSPIDWTKVVATNKSTKQVLIGGQPVDAGHFANLKAERQFILDSEIWRLIHETPKAEAEASMFVRGESLDDMKKGKVMLFTLSQQRNILDVFR